MQLMAFLLLKRQGFSPEQHIVLAATADEEAGSTWGAEWLMQHVPEKLNARWVINEGGGLGLKTGRSNLHFCQVAEKGVCWVRITFQGKPGHGSLPHDRNCVVEMARAIEALAAYRSPFVVTAPAEQFISGIAREQEYMPAAEFMKLLDPAQAEAACCHSRAGPAAGPQCLPAQYLHAHGDQGRQQNQCHPRATASAK